MRLSKILELVLICAISCYIQMFFFTFQGVNQSIFVSNQLKAPWELCKKKFIVKTQSCKVDVTLLSKLLKTVPVCSLDHAVSVTTVTLSSLAAPDL